MIRLKKFRIGNVDMMSKSRGLEKGGRTQKYIDRKVLELSEKYTPRDTGELINSARRSTKVGEGSIVYDTPYAHSVYHTKKNYKGSPMRGAYWFDRMKTDNVDKIRDEAAKVAGGRSEK